MEQKRLHYLTLSFLEGKLSEEDGKKLLSWIKESRDNKEKFLKEQQACNNLLLKDEDKTTHKHWEQLRSRIIPHLPLRKRPNLILRLTTYAAASIIGAFLTTLYVKGPTKTDTLQTVTIPFGARTHIVLPDSSKVWLNSGSTLTYASNFSRSRNLKLIGEAYFDVHKDKVPFLVSTLYGNVEAKGTTFNVKAFEDEYLQATLVSGIISVSNKLNDKKVILKPGQQAEFSETSYKIKKVYTNLFIAWKDGKLILDREYLPELKKRLERWYNVTIELDNDPRLKDLWYTGTIEMESFPEVLELLKATTPIDYSYDEDTRAIHIYFSEQSQLNKN